MIFTRLRPNAVLGLLWLAAILGPWLWATGHGNGHALSSPAHSIEITQEPFQLTYPANADSVVTWPLPRLLKAVPSLKGLEAAESQEGLPGILQKVGANVKAFFEDFPNTASVERISMEGFGGPGGTGWETHTEKFQYLALARPARSGVGMDEYRTDAKGQVVQPGGLGGGYFVTKAFVSMPLHFHPAYQAESTFRCLGRQAISRRQTYVVAFAQRPGIARVVGRINFGQTSILVLFQGIAWIDSTSYQIIRMRTDLLPSKESVGPRRQATEIEFQ